MSLSGNGHITCQDVLRIVAELGGAVVKKDVEDVLKARGGVFGQDLVGRKLGALRDYGKLEEGEIVMPLYESTRSVFYLRPDVYMSMLVEDH